MKTTSSRRTPALAALLLALAASALTGCNADDERGARDGTTASAGTSTATPSEKAPSDKAPSEEAPSDKAPSDQAPSEKAPRVEDLVILPGAIGDARVGMTRAEWSRTGLFADGAVLCEGELIHWAGQPEGLGVLTDEDATITQLTVATQGPHTRHGDIEVGSTYGELKAAWPDLTAPAEDGFDQASVYPPSEEDGNVYIAFLLDAPVDEVTDSTEVAVIGVSGGTKPNFQYDC